MNMASVNQAAPDICWKFQPLNGFGACLWHPKSSLCLPLAKFEQMISELVQIWNIPSNF